MVGFRERIRMRIEERRKARREEAGFQKEIARRQAGIRRREFARQSEIETKMAAREEARRSVRGGGFKRAVATGRISRPRPARRSVAPRRVSTRVRRIRRRPVRTAPRRNGSFIGRFR